MNTLLRRTLITALAATALVAGLRPSVAGLSSASARRLADTVAGGAMTASGSCSGTIDLTRATGSYSRITVAELNALILDNDGALVLVVDVNENNGGLETARAQGVAVKRAEVRVNGVTVGGGVANPATSHYPFSTQTQAQIAERGSTVRRTWYTVLGDAGSNEITPRKVDGLVFDSTLRIPITGTLPADATRVELLVEFLKTNDNLGDPEDFYDCTGGAEDLALVTHEQATYFDVTVPTTTAFRTESVAAQLSPEGEATVAASGTTSTTGSYSWLLMPGANAFRMVGYEDLFPDQGDYDFNDAVVAYRYGLRVDGNGMVDRISGEAYLVARGSNYTHEWHLSLPVTGLTAGATASCLTVMGDGATVPAGRECAIAADAGSIRWRAFDGTRVLLPPVDPLSPQQNTRPGTVMRGPRATFSVTLSTPMPLAAFGTDDPWLHVVDTRQDVHLLTRAAGSDLPFAVVVPSTFQVAQEGVDIVTAYPEFGTFVNSGGARGAGWYASPASGKVVDWKIGEEGRKLYSGTALYTESGRLCALGACTWIVLK